MRTFTTVICLNTNSEYDVTRFNSVLSPSIKFIKNKILVIPRYVDFLDTEGYKVITDKAVLGDVEIDNYKKQHLLKLYISKYIDTTHYLILDSDIYVNKKFDFEDFFDGDKIQLFIKDEYDNVSGDEITLDIWHVEWIRGAMKVLNKRPVKPFHYGVTPGLFITNEARSLITLLEAKFGNFIEYYKTNEAGCEYSLYYLFVNGKGYYKEEMKHISALWCSHNKLEDLSRTATFWIIQSNTKINNSLVYDYCYRRRLLQSS